MLARPDRVIAEPAGLGGEFQPLAIGLVVRLPQAAMGLEAEGNAEFGSFHYRVIPRCARDDNLPKRRPCGCAPVLDRLFLAGHELDGELRVARAAQRLDAPLDLGLARGERGLGDHLAVTNFFSCSFTNIRCPRWFSR
jgi:hypothetical protein